MFCSTCTTDTDKVEMVLLSGKLKGGTEIYVCPVCDIPDPGKELGKSIIEISREHHG